MEIPCAVRLLGLSLFAWLALPVAFADGGAALDVSWRTPVFVGRQEGYHTYRIPSLLLTTSGTLLAFCEGRKNSGADNGDIDTLVKRSEDGGRTWGAARVVWSEGENTCGNPTAVLDRDTGRIWIFLCHNLAADDGPSIRAGKSAGTRTVWVTHSDDDGATWAPPRDMTREVKPAGMTWDATGPGIGIQLRRGPATGRLVIPAIGRDIISDDHGKTWRTDGPTPPGTSEAQIVELADGRLLRSGRPAPPAKENIRRFPLTVSSDQGKTWSPLRYPDELITPVCQGSLIRHCAEGKAQRGVLLFCHPGSETKRERLTVRASYDDGATWPGAWVLDPGIAAYSCLASLDGGDIGCLYECGKSKKSERIDFARFQIPERTHHEKADNHE